jgi:hypothetical protein
MVIAGGAFDDSADISTLFHSGETAAWRNNFVGYSNPEVDALIVEAKTTLDREKQRTINQRLHSLLAEEQPYTFLWTLTNYAAAHRKVRHVDLHPFKFFTFADTWYIPKRSSEAPARPRGVEMLSMMGRALAGGVRTIRLLLAPWPCSSSEPGPGRRRPLYVNAEPRDRRSRWLGAGP